MVSVGDKAPDVMLATLEGQPLALADMWRGGRNVVLVFLRHLG